MAADTFVHFYENNPLPSHFNQYFQYIQTIDNYRNKFAISKYFILLGVNLSTFLRDSVIANLLDPRYRQKFLTISIFYLILRLNCTKTTLLSQLDGAK